MSPPRARRLAWALALALALALAVLPAAPAAAQGTVSGTVKSPAGEPVEGANVFLLPSLEGTSTDSAGRFAVRTELRGAATLVVQRIGFAERRLAVVLPVREPLEVTVAARAVGLEPVRALASTFGDDPARAGVSITPLQAVTTPGSAGDIYRALQTFPGVQTVNESAGLFVRGGDVSETKVLLDHAVVLSPYRLETPSGAAFGTFDPFLLKGVFFSSGGFGARYGDALSALVSLETIGLPARNTVSASASVAALSSSVAFLLPGRVGVRATGTRTSTGLLFRLNGRDDFRVAPEGTDLSASVVWSPRSGREVKLFGLQQTDRVTGAADPEVFHSAFTADREAGLVVLSGKDVWGDWSPSFSVSASRASRLEEYRAFRLERLERYLQGRAELAWQARGELTLRAGLEVERRTSVFGGFVPESSDDDAAGAPVRFLDFRVAGVRDGAWLESEWRPWSRLQATAGLRTDGSDLSGRRTVDPRLAAALQLGGKTALTAAWGVYHQVPGPLGYDSTVGKPGLPPMRAAHWIAGVVTGDAAGETGTLLRVEVYRKSYRDLVQLGRGFALGDRGEGATRGVDVFVRGTAPGRIATRLSYSLISARRTDPNTGEMARSPYDITHNVVLIAEREWKERWRLGATYRTSTGAPYTEVRGARLEEERWIPEYDAPFAARLPRFERLDVTASRLHSFWSGNMTTLYVSVSNVLNRPNVSGYRYNEDYTQRAPAGSLFRRTVYFGVTTSTQW